jgi:hypothetical protein
MVMITCRRCFRRAQIEMPPIGARLRCTACNEAQQFGTRPRRRRVIAGVTRFSDRRAPPIAPDGAPLNDSLDHLFEEAG